MNIITIIGAGNMGSAIAKKILQSNFCTAESLCVSDPNAEKLEYFERLGCPTSTNASDFIADCDVIILAIKPQKVRELLSEWKKLFSSNVVLCSIAAGISELDLQHYSGIEKIIRIMPNTPLLVGEGVCGWHANSSVETHEKDMMQKMLNYFGLAIECHTENMIDSITALSGSGPAYYFYVLEQMQVKAEELGFPSAEAKEIALQTMRGAGELAFQSDKSFAELRKNITSPNGTTASAIEFFEKNQLGEIWKGGIESAYQRSKEL